MTLLDYIHQKGLQYKEQAGELILEVCPFCHDEKYHFYLDQRQETAPFFCHKCNARGNLLTLQKHMGDKPQRATDMTAQRSRKPQGIIEPAFKNDKAAAGKLPDDKAIEKMHDRLLNDPEALAYVTEQRGISIETTKGFKLGMATDRSGSRWLTIPHYEKGRLQNVKYRSIPPAEKAFKRIAGCRSVLFNGDCLQGAEEIFICEGELDAITLIDRGIKNTVAATTGAGSFDAEWIDQLAAVKKIYLCYDPDEAGRKGARELARRLGYDRCFNVELPEGQDVNDYFKQHDVFEFQALVNQARQYDVAGILSFAGVLKNLSADLSTEQQEGIKTGFVSVDRLLKTGFQPGDLIILSAPPKIGKSSFALQMALHNACELIPSLFYCLEMRPKRVGHKIVQCYCRSEHIDHADIRRTENELDRIPLYIGYNYQKPTLDGVIDTIKQSIRRYGLRLVVFDHLHFLCRSINNQVQEVGQAVQAFKFLAEELETPIVVIAQPRKINPDAIMSAQDLKDSSSIYSDCDHLLIMHRKRRATSNDEVSEGMEIKSEAFESLTLIRLEASRYNSGGEALLKFKGECSRFNEVAC